MAYLPAQPTEVLTPQAPLRHLLARLRSRAIEEGLLPDGDVVALMSEGYQRACERALCLQSIATVTLTGSLEYALPTDHFRTIKVFLSGAELELLPERIAQRTGLVGYYIYGSTVGVQPVPSDGQQLYLLYARTPDPFTDVDSVPEAGFPPEFYYLLVHYARSKAYLLSGGAGRIRQAVWERDQYDRGVSRLRQAVSRTDAARLLRFNPPLPGRRPAFANDVDVR